MPSDVTWVSSPELSAKNIGASSTTAVSAEPGQSSRAISPMQTFAAPLVDSAVAANEPDASGQRPHVVTA